jgi:hypothetical protein
VEVLKESFTVGEVFYGFPSFAFASVFVASPSNEVFDLVSNLSRIEDRIDLVFGETIDFDRRWRWLSSIGDRVRTMKG